MDPKVIMTDIMETMPSVNPSSSDLQEATKALKEDEKLVLVKQKQSTYRAPYAYTAYGNGRRLKKQDSLTSINIVKAMSEMTKPEQRVFNALNSCMLESDHVEGIISISNTKAGLDTDSWKKGIKSLVEKDFIRRVGARRKFIVNPRLIVPTGDPSVPYTYTREQKVEAHKKYIDSIVSNWESLNSH